MMERRQLLAMLVATMAATVPSGSLRAMERVMEELIPEFGLICHVTVKDGQRADYIRILRQMSRQTGEYGGMNAFENAQDENGVVTLEFWRDARARETALQLPKIAPLMEKLDRLTQEVLTRTEINIPKSE